MHRLDEVAHAARDGDGQARGAASLGRSEGQAGVHRRHRALRVPVPAPQRYQPDAICSGRVCLTGFPSKGLHQSSTEETQHHRLTTARRCRGRHRRGAAPAYTRQRFFFERNARLYLVTSRHVLIDEPSAPPRTASKLNCTSTRPISRTPSATRCCCTATAEPSGGRAATLRARSTSRRSRSTAWRCPSPPFYVLSRRRT